MNREEARKILEEVKENHRKLSSCVYHEFERIGDYIPTRFKCKRCNGEIDGINYNWYMKGIEHERKGDKK